MMAYRILVLLGVLLTAIASPIAADEWDDLAAKLRARALVAEDVERLVGGLVDGGRLIAASWWLAEVERAVETKQLPRSARAAFAALHKRLAAASAKRDPEATALGMTMAKAALAATRKGCRFEALRACDATDVHLLVFANPAAVRVVKNARRRAMRLAPKVEKTELPFGFAEHVEQSRTAIVARFEPALAAFAGVGSGEGYGLARRVIERHYDLDEAMERLRTLREAARPFTPTRKIRLLVARATVRIDETDVGSILGPDIVQLDENTAPTPTWPPISFDALRGDLVTIAPRSSDCGWFVEVDGRFDAKRAFAACSDTDFQTHGYRELRPAFTGGVTERRGSMAGRETIRYVADFAGYPKATRKLLPDVFTPPIVKRWVEVNGGTARSVWADGASVYCFRVP